MRALKTKKAAELSPSGLFTGCENWLSHEDPRLKPLGPSLAPTLRVIASTKTDDASTVCAERTTTTLAGAGWHQAWSGVVVIWLMILIE